VLRIAATRQAVAVVPAPRTLVPRYVRHIPEHTLLYRLVRDHYPAFVDRLAEEGRAMPAHVHGDFEEFLRCGRLEYGFLRVRCQDCLAERLVAFSCKRRGSCPSCGARRMAESARLLVEDVFGPRPVRQWVLSFPFLLRFLFASRPETLGPVLAIVYRVIAGWLADEAGIPRASTQAGAVTLIQRFGSALNLNVHFHMLFLDGVYDAREEDPLRLHRTRAPTPAQMAHLAATIARRVCRHLEKRGYLESEGEGGYLSDRACREDGLDAVRMHAITYRIATGPHAGRKVTTVQTLPGDDDSFAGEAGRAGGFSLHAGVSARASEGDKLERLCRYISRPALCEKRLALTAQGRVSYSLKTPWRDGTTHVEFEPVEFLARLAALVPPPRAHLTRFHGVFAPNARLRAQLTPARRGKRATADTHGDTVRDLPDQRTPEDCRRAMTWAQRLKRVFGIDIATCLHCGGAVRILASVEEPDAIEKILEHFDRQGALPQAYYQPATRGPPAAAA